MSTLTGLDIGHFHRFIVDPALGEMDFFEHNTFNTIASTRLMVFTGVVESRLKYLIQVNHSLPFLKKALGIYQMERDTFNWLWYEYAPKKVPNLWNMYKHKKAIDLISDLRFATHMARLKYFSIPHSLPKPDDWEGIVYYWRRWYNGRDITFENETLHVKESYLIVKNYFDRSV